MWALHSRRPGLRSSAGISQKNGLRWLSYHPWTACAKWALPSFLIIRSLRYWKEQILVKFRIQCRKQKPLRSFQALTELLWVIGTPVRASQVVPVVKKKKKKTTCQCRRQRESLGQRNLAGYPGVHSITKSRTRPKRLSTHAYTSCPLSWECWNTHTHAHTHQLKTKSIYLNHRSADQKQKLGLGWAGLGSSSGHISFTPCLAGASGPNVWISSRIAWAFSRQRQRRKWDLSWVILASIPLIKARFMLSPQTGLM